MSTMNRLRHLVVIVVFLPSSVSQTHEQDILNITVGLLQTSNFPLSQSFLDRITIERANNTEYRIRVSVLGQSLFSEVELLQYVSTLRCKGVVILVAPAPCVPDVTDILLLSRIPTVIFEPDPFCFPNNDIMQDKLIIYPRVWGIAEVIGKLVTDQYEQVKFYYGIGVVDHVPTVIRSLEVALSSVLGVSSLFLADDKVDEVVNKTGLVGPEAYSHHTLHIVWTANNITVQLLEAVNQNASMYAALDILSHWLIVCTNQQCLDHMTTLLPKFKININQLAILNIIRKPINSSTMELLFEDLFGVIEKTMTLAVTGKYNITSGNQPETCEKVNETFVDNVLLPSFERYNQTKICDWYETYVAKVNMEPYSLKPMNFCMGGGRVSDHVELFPNRNAVLSGKHLLVTTIESAPFVMSEKTNNTNRFFGLAIDMLKELSRILNFTYTLTRVPDGQFGGMKEDGSWTGMVGQLQRKEVDMSVASLSATDARDNVVDFVEYYFEYGAAIMTKPDEDENKWRVIVLPFRWSVWLCIVVSIPFAGLVAWAITLAVHRSTNGSNDKDQFANPMNTLWYTFGTVLAQGNYYLPKSSSGRTFLCHWWVFSIIMVASYCGSLIAYLSIPKTDAPFVDLEGMLAQTRYKWGLREGTVYYTTFENASGGVFKKVWDGARKFAEKDPSIFSESAAIQLSKVNEGNYVFIMDRTPSIYQAISDEDCNLFVLPETFMPLPFGIGIQEESPYQHVINKAVKKLQRSGLIKFWERKWWPKHACSGIPVAESHAVSLLDTQSAFYLLLAGVMAAAVVLFLELARYGIRRLHRGRRSEVHKRPISRQQRAIELTTFEKEHSIILKRW